MYTDPYAGWVNISGVVHVVRQRSPWKKGYDVNKLAQPDFRAFVEQVAIITATSHTRGSVGAAPVRFKDVIARAFADGAAVERWGEYIALIAAAYREQVLLDFGCFRKWAKEFLAQPVDGRERTHIVAADEAMSAVQLH